MRKIKEVATLLSIGVIFWIYFCIKVVQFKVNPVRVHEDIIYQISDITTLSNINFSNNVTSQHNEINVTPDIVTAIKELTIPNPAAVYGNRRSEILSALKYMKKLGYHGPLHKDRRTGVAKKNIGYIIANSACRHNPGGLILILVISSKADHFQKRSIMRQKYLKKYQSQTHPHVRYVFLLGVADEVQEKVDNENKQHRDILQGDFEEKYSNLVFKNILGIQWFSTHCNESKYFMKIDDDVVLNLENVLKHLPGLTKKYEPMMMGFCANTDAPYRGGPYAVSKTDYPLNAWPAYCKGFGYIITGYITVELLPEMWDCPFEPMDDVFVGMAMLFVRHDINIIHFPDMFPYSKKTYESIMVSLNW